jgi:anti-sigma B factor antagonist
MRIDASREGGSAVLRLGGRLDREGAEQLSHTLEDLLRDGVRSLRIDLSDVTYISSAATTILARWQEELATLRGEVQLTSMSPNVRETLAIAGWDSRAAPQGGLSDLRLSSWQHRADAATSGQYQTSSCVPEGTLSCRLHGHPYQLFRAPLRADDCEVVSFPGGTFGFGLGAIGASYQECHERLGELIAVEGCVAYFPSDAARLADYLVGVGPVPPRALLASSVTCEGGFSKLVRFSPQPDAGAIPLSELAGVCLDGVGGNMAGLVIAAETAGLCGTRLRRSPAASASPAGSEIPAVREWLSFAPERIHPLTTALIAGVVARSAKAPLAPHLRPMGVTGQLSGHFHAAVFSYHPLPQRTVELGALVRGLFFDHELRDVLHLLSDDRGDGGVGESVLVRGVAWVSAITQVS